MEKKMHRYVKGALPAVPRMCAECGDKLYRYYVCRDHGVVVCARCRARKHRKCSLDFEEVER